MKKPRDHRAQPTTTRVVPVDTLRAATGGALYVGDGKVVHTPTAGDHVRLSA